MDFHTHTNLSVDGEESLEELLIKAEKENYSCISITDHNTVLAHVILQYINKEKYFKGTIIPGIEIDAIIDGITIDILAYNFNVEPVYNWAKEKFGTPTYRQTIIRNKLMNLCNEKNIKIDQNFAWDSKKEYAHENVFRNIKQYKENDKKLNVDVYDRNTFYRNSTMNKNFTLYMNMDFLWANINDVKSIIHNNGGKIFLAHPYNYSENINVEKLLDLTLKYNFDGIEVYHPSHTQEQINHLLDFCKKHNLLIIGGSDYHGKEGQELAKDLKGKIYSF